MDNNQFTIKTQEIIQAAQETALLAGNQAVENPHLLKGIFLKDSDVVPFILKQNGVDQEMLEQALDRILSTFRPKHSKPYSNQSYWQNNRATNTFRLKCCLWLCWKATTKPDNYSGTAKSLKNK